MNQGARCLYPLANSIVLLPYIYGVLLTGDTSAMGVTGAPPYPLKRLETRTPPLSVAHVTDPIFRGVKQLTVN